MRDNLIFTAGAGLGFCSSLAVTNKLENSLTMGLGVTLVTAGSFCMVYPFKKLISLAGTQHKISLVDDHRFHFCGYLWFFCPGLCA